MTENEVELIILIREDNNPELALITALTIIMGYLKRHESSVSQASADLQELC